MSPKRPVVVFATKNLGKAKEVQALLPMVELQTLHDHPEVVLPEETGTTFEANARVKATAAAKALGHWTLADDSGLEVDALDGEPGVRSARYVEGSDADRVQALLRALEEIPDEERGARFVCSLALAISADEVVVAEGRWEGRIAKAAAGGGGFGYDPVFVPAGLDLSAAELPAVEKNRQSHRAIALAALKPQLQALVDAD